MGRQKPIVLLELKGGNFDFADALEMLSDLEANLPPRNPWAVDDLKEHLNGEPLHVLSQTVVRALEKGREAKVPALNLNGTSNQLEVFMGVVESVLADTC
jgi:hypothetical protein